MTIPEARESDFVQRVYGPFQVDTREQAVEQIKQAEGGI